MSTLDDIRQSYWHVRDDETGETTRALYIEHVRAVGTDPWGTFRPAAQAPSTTSGGVLSSASPSSPTPAPARRAPRGEVHD